MDVLNLVHSSSDSDEDRPPVRKIYKPRVNFDVISDFQFREKFRMRRHEVELVLSRIGYRLLNSDRSYALGPDQQLLVTLHWMGNDGQYHGVADMHGISKATVCRLLHRVIQAIIDIIFREVVVWPINGTEEAEIFFRKGGFPSVCGCVDGTLINIDAPHYNEDQFVDRDGNHSINAMMMCGPDYRFYSVNARWPGSVHDSRVLRNSAIYRRFENGYRPFPGAVILGKINTTFLPTRYVMRLNNLKSY